MKVRALHIIPMTILASLLAFSIALFNPAAASSAVHHMDYQCTDCHTTDPLLGNPAGILGTINGTALDNFDPVDPLFFADTTENNGICQVCHTVTSYWRSDGSGTNHNPGTLCTESCHDHCDKFLEGSGGNNAPLLSWSGNTGFQTDGVDPNTAQSGSTFSFEVKYSDVDNDAPAVFQVLIDIDDSGTYEPGEIFAMTGSGSDYASGVVYTYNTTVSFAGDGILNYRFEFTDGIDAATGAPTLDHTLTVLPDCTDVDGDTYSPEGGACGPVDCDDSDPDVNPGVVENCSNGIDDDCDGFTDSADSDCPSCSDYTIKDECNLDPNCEWIGSPKHGFCQDTCTVTEDPETTCDDGIDNDCDGLTDTDDPNCAPCDSSPEICDDGIDNDCDGKTDCADKKDCGKDPAC